MAMDEDTIRQKLRELLQVRPARILAREWKIDIRTLLAIASGIPVQTGTLAIASQKLGSSDRGLQYVEGRTMSRASARAR